VIPEHLLRRYVNWFEKQLRSFKEKKRLVIMLADRLIGELYLGKDGYLHWQPLVTDDAFEALAALEHEQWMAWSRAVADEVSEERRQRWQEFWKSYEELPENIKEQDRIWARKVLEVLDLKRYKGG
jgi:hypothetical protein